MDEFDAVPKARGWEYRNEVIPAVGLDASLTHLGADGWELVWMGLVPVRASPLAQAAQQGFLLVFKRPLTKKAGL